MYVMVRRAAMLRQRDLSTAYLQARNAVVQKFNEALKAATERAKDDNQVAAAVESVEQGVETATAAAAAAPGSSSSSESDTPPAAPAPRKRGRPAKTALADRTRATREELIMPPRKRGRPSKADLLEREKIAHESDEAYEQAETVATAMPKKRGRPSKAMLAERMAQLESSLHDE